MSEKLSKRMTDFLNPYFPWCFPIGFMPLMDEFKDIEFQNITLKEQLANVRREVVFAISKAETDRAEQVREEADLNGYSRGVADTEFCFAEAEKLIAKSYDNQVIVVRGVCHNFIGEVLQGEKLQDIVIYHLGLMRKELEKALGGETTQIPFPVSGLPTRWRNMANRAVPGLYAGGELFAKELELTLAGKDPNDALGSEKGISWAEAEKIRKARDDLFPSDVNGGVSKEEMKLEQK